MITASLTSVYQAPKVSIVANDIFAAPTMFLNKSDNLYCLNSITILSYLKIHTMIIDIETMIWDKSAIKD